MKKKGENRGEKRGKKGKRPSGKVQICVCKETVVFEYKEIYKK